MKTKSAHVIKVLSGIEEFHHHPSNRKRHNRKIQILHHEICLCHLLPTTFAHTIAHHQLLLAQYYSVSLKVCPQQDRSSKPFPEKLYDMLEAVEELDCSDAFPWLHHGRAFVVFNNDKFMNVLIPRFFRQTTTRSFTRQLSEGSKGDHILKSCQ